MALTTDTLVTTRPRVRLRTRVREHALQRRAAPREPLEWLRRHEALACALMFAALAALVFGPHIARGGYYDDDWHYFDVTVGDGFFAAVKAFGWTSFRPLQTVYWPLIDAVFGLHKSLRLVWSVGLAVSMAGLLFALLRRLGIERVAAVVIASLVLLFPASDSTRLWAAADVSSLAISLYLAGSLVAWRALARGGSRGALAHALAVALYVLSVLTYEIAAGAILLSLALYRRRAPWRRAAGRWVADVVAVGATLAFVTSHTFYDTASIGDDVSHAGDIAGDALSIVSRAAVPFGKPSTAVVIAVLGAIAVAGALAHSRVGGALVWSGARARRVDALQLRRWLATAAAAITAIAVGYVMFVPATDFHPLDPGTGNRVNALAAIGVVTLIYALAAVLGALVFPGRRRASAAFAALIGMTIGIGYAVRVRSDAAHWDRAATAQDRVIAAVRETLGRPPANSVIYTFGAPAWTAPGVPVFKDSSDLEGALRAVFHEPSLTAYPALAGTTLRCGRRHVAIDTSHGSFDDYDLAPSPYGSTFVIDVTHRFALRIVSPAACAGARSRFRPGPWTLS